MCVCVSGGGAVVTSQRADLQNCVFFSTFLKLEQVEQVKDGVGCFFFISVESMERRKTCYCQKTLIMRILIMLKWDRLG